MAVPLPLLVSLYCNKQKLQNDGMHKMHLKNVTEKLIKCSLIGVCLLDLTYY